MSSYPASDKIMNHLGQIWFDSEACIVFRRWKRWIYQPTLGLRFQMTRWAFLGSFSATSTRPLSAGSFHCGHTALRNRFGCHDMLSPANDYCSPHLGPLPPPLPSLLPSSLLASSSIGCVLYYRRGPARYARQKWSQFVGKSCFSLLYSGWIWNILRFDLTVHDWRVWKLDCIIIVKIFRNIQD